jgi:hypothetical protein
VAAGSVDAQPAGRRRALLVGVDDYTASHLDAQPGLAPAPGRDWPNLKGAVGDVGAIGEMLVLLYGFDPHDIVTLTDQAATRAAILETLDDLARNAGRGDIILFYYAGHGSQVRNSLSDELDELDESLVPADSRAGARDIRDKELRRIFNRILDRGARLTVILDNCHSGSGARGLATGARPRGVKADLRDVADAAEAGPRPEDRGALVLSAAQDFDAAWETRDERGTFHGAFSWALMRAMRDSSPGETAMETFLRAQARMRAETPFQEPVLAGNAEARLTPLLGDRGDRRGERTVVAVEKVKSDGTVIIQGGWANGLSIGTELRAIEGRSTVHLAVTAMHGLGQSEARLKPPGRPMPHAIQAGALLEVVGWAAPPARPLHVWMPRVAVGVNAIAGLARSLAEQAAKLGVRWVSDPIDVTPTHLLRREAGQWELLGPDGVIQQIGSDDSAIAAVSAIPPGSSLFVQFAAPVALIEALGVGPGSDREDIEPVDRPEDADYLLVGRYSSRHLGFAWVRPCVKRVDRRKTGLPLRTAWIVQDSRSHGFRDLVPVLRDAILRLRRVQAWQLLESPAETPSPYRLVLRRVRDHELAREGVVIGEEKYGLLLHAVSPLLPPHVRPRYVYAFVIDSYGKSTLLFPQDGSVENRLPLPPDPAQTEGYPPKEIPLGRVDSFEVAPPYGVDTYFLLSTDEPLPNPWILEWDGVRTRNPRALTPLDQLLALTGSASRSTPIVTPSSWSIERVVYESVPPRASPKHVR